MRKRRCLLDVNVLIALTDDEHEHYRAAMQWFNTSGKHDFGVCALTEAGYIRVVSRPSAVGFSIKQATAVLADLARQPGYRFWPMVDPWSVLTAPFAERIFGHQQVTDAILLGLAVKENGVLVTFDRGIRYLAGPQFSENVVMLGNASGSTSAPPLAGS